SERGGGQAPSAGRWIARPVRIPLARRPPCRLIDTRTGPPSWAPAGLSRPRIRSRPLPASASCSRAATPLLLGGGHGGAAAVAVGSTLNVVEPFMSSVGGIGLMLISRTRERHVL